MAAVLVTVDLTCGHTRLVTAGLAALSQPLYCVHCRQVVDLDLPTCRVCGCTDGDPCLACSLLEDVHRVDELCSACVQAYVDARQLVRVQTVLVKGGLL